MFRFLFLALLLVLTVLPARAQGTALDEQPRLIGGLQGLAQEISYPDAAKAEGVEGTVFVRFVVDEEGRVTEPEVARGVSPALDAEALRVTRQARFTPGRKNGGPVKVEFTLPVRFRLSDEQVEDR